jgi:hypothetical protein
MQPRSLVRRRKFKLCSGQGSRGPVCCWEGSRPLPNRSFVAPPLGLMD